MPEAWMLSGIRWQLFITLTFKFDIRAVKQRNSARVGFCRGLCEEAPKQYFPDLLICSRWERHLPDGQGHFHLLVAGLDVSKLNKSFCRAQEERWWIKNGARADIQLYDEALGGLDYVLKLPQIPSERNCWKALEQTSEWDELQPTLSESIIRYLRKAR